MSPTKIIPDYRFVKTNRKLYKWFRDTGYTHEEASRHCTVKLTPKQLKEEIESKFPNEFLYDRHQELLMKEEIKTVWNKQTKQWEQMSVGMDADAVAKGLDLAYRLKGYLKSDNKVDVNFSIFNDFSDAELDIIIAGNVSPSAPTKQVVDVPPTL